MASMHCIFYVPSQAPCCQVLQAMHTPPLMRRTQENLARRYCTAGTFFRCPLFLKVEQGLAGAWATSRWPSKPSRSVEPLAVSVHLG